MKVYCSRQPIDIVKQLAGKDAWIRVFLKCSYLDGGYKAWIKILRIYDDDSYDGQHYEEGLCNFLEYRLDEEPVAWNIPLSDIEPEIPYEILQGDEFEEFIADIKSRFGI